jgi:hypothetical protein
MLQETLFVVAPHRFPKEAYSNLILVTKWSHTKENRGKLAETISLANARKPLIQVDFRALMETCGNGAIDLDRVGIAGSNPVRITLRSISGFTGIRE